MSGESKTPSGFVLFASGESDVWVALGSESVDLSGEGIFDLLPTDTRRQTSDLWRMLLIALFSDAKAQPGDIVDESRNGFVDLRGWWADAYSEGAPSLGSRLWLLRRASATIETADLARGYVEEALAPLVAQGLFAKVDVSTYIESGALCLDVTCWQHDEKQVGLRFADLWKILG